MQKGQPSPHPKPKLVEVVAGEVLRLKIPMEVPTLEDGPPVFSGSVNGYLVRTARGGWLIIDTGFCNQTGREAWELAIQALHLRPGAVEAVLVTHCHPDHIGMAGRLSRRLSAPVYLHPADQTAFVRDWGGGRSGGAALRQMRAYGMPESAAGPVEEQLQARAHVVSPCETVLPLEDGARFPVCAGALRAVHVPGHSDGQCVLLWPERRLLFSADLLLPASFAPLGLHPSGDRDPVGTALTTLRGFLRRDLAGLTVLPGHGWAFPDPAARAGLCLTHYLERCERYARLCARGAETAWQAALALEVEGDRRQRRALMWEAMAYLDYLARCGRLVREAGPGGVRFTGHTPSLPSSFG